MLEQIHNAILNRRVLQIRIDGTPEGNYIRIEPHIVLHNILHDTIRILVFIIDHWAVGGHRGWTDIALDSLVELLETEEIFDDRNPKPVDWQLHDQIFPRI